MPSESVFYLTGIFLLFGVLVYIYLNFFESDNDDDINADYLTGLKYLLNEESDKAINLFSNLIEIDDETMFKNAIKGLVEGLDPHSSFLDPEDQSDLSESTMGKFGGIGIVIGTEGSFIEIISPIDDTPAYRAGLQAGDIILKIDDQNVNQIDLEWGFETVKFEYNQCHHLKESLWQKR